MNTANRPQEASVPVSADAPRRLILLVDDSRAQRRMLAIQLQRAGFRVAEAESGCEALDLCRSLMPDIILSDWVMPGMTGPELCQAFRAMDRDNYGYFILLTSKSDRDDITRGLAAGADDFLHKPISGDELLARLAASERLLSFQEALRVSNEKLRATLDQLHAAQEAMERDLAEARKLQQGLVRERSARLGPFDLSLLLRPAGHIGGDLVGFFRIDDHRSGVYAIDVSGHGVAAALLTAQIASHLTGSIEQNVALRMRATSVEPLCPTDLARFFNRMLIDELQTETYLTMVYAELDQLTGEVRLVQAGHPHPVIQRRDGSVEQVGRGGMPIGLFDSAEFEETRVVLGPGDRLLIVSDGITEATNPAGRQLGEDGLQAVLRTNAILRGHSFLESMSWSVSEYAKGSRGDDVSAVLIEHRVPGQTMHFPLP